MLIGAISTWSTLIQLYNGYATKYWTVNYQILYIQYQPSKSVSHQSASPGNWYLIFQFKICSALKLMIALANYGSAAALIIHIEYMNGDL